MPSSSNLSPDGELLDDRDFVESDLSINDYLAPSDVYNKQQGQERTRKIKNKLKGIKQSSSLHPDGMRAMGTQHRPGRLSS